MILIKAFWSIVRFILLFILFMFLWRLVQSLFRRAQRSQETGRDSIPHDARTPLGVGQTVRDPVCGMHIATELAVRGQDGAYPVYFCSEECKKRYQPTHV